MTLTEKTSGALGSALFLFDIDGTLVDTRGAGMVALDSAFEEVFGVPKAFAGYDFRGKTDRQILRDAAQRWIGRGPSEEETQVLARGYLRGLQSQMTTLVDSVRVHPGIVAMLDELESRCIPTGLATGNIAEGARMKLEPLKLWERFPFGGFGSDAEHRGQLTAIGIMRGLKLVRSYVPATRVFVVGDSPLDIRAARYAGARSVGVMTGWSSREEIAAEGPDFLFQDLADVHGVLNALGIE